MNICAGVPGRSEPTGSGRGRRQRLPLLTPFIVLAVLLSPLSAPAPAALAVSSAPWCPPTTEIPAEAYAVERYVRSHNFSPPPGLKGGRPYVDGRHQLPAHWRPYKEYDVHPKPPGQGRLAARVVLSPALPTLSWYSPDHYQHFFLMHPSSCLPNGPTIAPRPYPKPMPKPPPPPGPPGVGR